jgi:hypothetical protein
LAELAEIRSRPGLDYADIDFGLNQNGEILLFGVTATIVVNPPEPDEKWAYQRPAVDRIYAAVRTKLADRSGQ